MNLFTRRTVGPVVGAAVIGVSLAGAGSAYAATPAPTPPRAGAHIRPEVRVTGWPSAAELRPGGRAGTFTVRLYNDTHHTLRNVAFGYRTDAAERPVVQELRHGRWAPVRWEHTGAGRRGGEGGAFALLGHRTVREGATAGYQVRVSVPRHWEKKITRVRAAAGAEGKGWKSFRPVDFRVEKARPA
ncbi:hypothetical protein AB0O07_13705 [Streptomyces sp. NPDC093085]|uniref:hypothetical protein n=1 Tax=Streptomyces sp. NPDC093085 TaxID=3155068 RepID=UPI003448F64A